jgi:hypothetical protein
MTWDGSVMCETDENAVLEEVEATEGVGIMS